MKGESDVQGGWEHGSVKEREGTWVGAAGGAGALAPTQRWSASRKRDVVLRLLRGESLDAVSREVGVELYRLEAWKARALAGLELGLKDRLSPVGDGDEGVPSSSASRGTVRLLAPLAVDQAAGLCSCVHENASVYEPDSHRDTRDHDTQLSTETGRREDVAPVQARAHHAGLHRARPGLSPERPRAVWPYEIVVTAQELDVAAGLVFALSVARRATP